MDQTKWIFVASTLMTQLCVMLGLHVRTSAQTFDVFDPVTSAFPVVRSSFLAFDSSGKRIAPTLDEMGVFENKSQRRVISVWCPSPKNPDPISAVLVFDVSGSMSAPLSDGVSNLSAAKEAGKTFVNAMNLPASEVAVTSFESESAIVTDFTTNIGRAQGAISSLSNGGSTNFNAALFSSNTSGLAVAMAAQHKKVIVFLTDGVSTQPTRVAEITALARSIGARIFCVALNTTVTADLVALADGTNGLVLGPIRSLSEARRAFLRLAAEAQNLEPCIIEWESKPQCYEQNISATVFYDSIGSTVNFIAPEVAVADFLVFPSAVRIATFTPGMVFDTSVRITTQKDRLEVYDISSGDPRFTISPTRLTLQKGDTATLRIAFNSQDDSYLWTSFEVQTSSCSGRFFASAGQRRRRQPSTSLRITHPNGKEVFVAGSDTNMTWIGVPADDTVALDLSIDAGRTWTTVTPRTRGLRHAWTVPNTPSFTCLARVRQGGGLGASPDTVVRLVGHRKLVHQVAWSVDGKSILSASADGTIRVWNPFISSGSIVKLTHIGSANSAAWSGNGRQILSGGDDYLAKIYDQNLNSVVDSLPGQRSEVSAVAWSGDSRRVFVGGRNGWLRIYDMSQRFFIDTLIYSWPIRYLSTSQDGTFLAVAVGKDIYVYRTTDMSLVTALQGHTADVNALDWSPDSRMVVSCSDDRSIRGWFLSNSGRNFRISTLSTTLTGLALNSDATILATNGRDGNVVLWDLAFQEVIDTLKGSIGYVTSIDWSPSSDWITAGTASGDIYVWVHTVPAIQSDISDTLFAIVRPTPNARHVDMGSLVVGTSRDSLVVRQTWNDGTYRFRVDSIGIVGGDAQDFQVVSSLFPAIVDSGRGLDAEFRFRPLSVGRKAARILVYTQSGVVERTISGEALAPVLEVVGDLIDYGTVEIGKWKDTVDAPAVRNIANYPVTITGVSMGGPNVDDFSVVDNVQRVLRPQDTLRMSGRFRPSLLGRTSGSLEVSYRGGPSPVKVGLLGRGIARQNAPKLRAFLEGFDTVRCSSSAIDSLVLVSVGTDTLVVTGIRTSTSQPFSIVTETMPRRLSPGQQLALPVVFAPMANQGGEFSAQIIIESNDIDSPELALPLRGVHVPESWSVSYSGADTVCLGASIPVEVVIRSTSYDTIPFRLRSNSVSWNPPAGMIPPGDSVKIRGVWQSVASPGIRSDELVVDAGSCGITRQIPLSLTVVDESLSIDTAIMVANVGSQANGVLRLSNRSAAPVRVQQVLVEHSFDLDTSRIPPFIGAGQTIQVPVRYRANDTAQVTSTVRVRTDRCQREFVGLAIGRGRNANAVLQIGSAKGFPGDEVVVPLRLVSKRNLVELGVTGLRGQMSFNSTLLEPRFEYLKSAIVSGRRLLDLDVSFTSEQPIVGEYRFRVGLGNDTISTISMSSVQSVGGVADIEVLPGSFELLGICRDGGLRLLSPSGSSLAMRMHSGRPVSLELQAIEIGPHRITIYTSGGQLIVQTTLDLENGTHILHFDTPELSNGFYYLVVQTSSMVRSIGFPMIDGSVP